MIGEKRASPWEFIGAVLFCGVLPTMTAIGILLDYLRHVGS
jgi:hypothetical protein